VTVGGQRVACLVVTVKQTFSGQYAGTVTTTTHWYVDRLTPVRQRTDSNLHSDQGNYEQHASVTLQRLTPR
jgi:hypothetical protein